MSDPVSNITEIQTKQQHEAALEELTRLWGSPPGTPDGDRVDRLIDAVVAYEAVHYAF